MKIYLKKKCTKFYLSSKIIELPYRCHYDKVHAFDNHGLLFSDNKICITNEEVSVRNLIRHGT